MLEKSKPLKLEYEIKFENSIKNYFSLPLIKSQNLENLKKKLKIKKKNFSKIISLNLNITKNEEKNLLSNLKINEFSNLIKNIILYILFFDFEIFEKKKLRKKN